VTTTTYTYNGDGDRVAQTVDDGVNPALTTAYVLDTAVPLTMVLSETTGPDTIYYLHGLGLVAQSDGADTEYFAYDGLGSVRQVTDATGGVLLAQTFDPYGNAYARTLDAEWTGGARFGFTGEYTDANGLLFLRARYYNPLAGRFFQMDPSRQEMNPYQYSMGNPILYTDPSGNKAGVPSWGEAYPVQPPGCETWIPKWWDEDYVSHQLEFEPDEDFRSLPRSVFEDLNYNLPPQWRLYQNRCDNNMCWILAISAVTYMLGDGLTPQEVDEIAQEAGFSTCDVTLHWQDLGTIAAHEDIDLKSKSREIAELYEDFYPEVRRRLLGGQRAIALVGICGTSYKEGKWVCGGYRERGSTLGELGVPTGQNGHFVVLTGLSIMPKEKQEEEQGWTRRSMNNPAARRWQWVRLYDPFDNQTEYHRAWDFHRWLDGQLVWMWE
jgi:RHS repeat-associated protein